MTKIRSRRLLTALGIGVALTIAAGAASFGAQTAPRGLPANPPQSETRQQDQTAPAPQDRQDGRQTDGRADRRGGFLEQRIELLHRRLRITPAQERVWAAFANELRGEARNIRDRLQGRRGRQDGRDNDVRNREDGRRGDSRQDDGRQAGERRGPPNVVGQLERRAQRLRDQQARAQRLLLVVRPLYAALDQDQKRIADRVLLEAERVGGFFNRNVARRGGRARDDGSFEFDGLQRRDSNRAY